MAQNNQSTSEVMINCAISAVLVALIALIAFDRPGIHYRGAVPLSIGIGAAVFTVLVVFSWLSRSKQRNR